MKYLLLLITFSFGVSQLSSQTEMTLLGQWSDPTLVPGTQYNNTYNEIWGYAINGKEYAIIGSTMGTHFIDVTDPTDVFERFFIEGASAGGQIIHRDYHDFGGYLYAVADEGESTLQIMDLTQLPDTVIVNYDSDDLVARSHNIFIDTTAAKLYMLSAKGGDSSFKAMKIYTLEDPLNPVKIGQYGVIDGEGFGHVHDAYVDNDIAFMNCGGDGLFIVDFSGNDPALLSRFSTLDYPQSGYNHSGWVSEDMEYYYFADETWGTSMKVVELNGLMDIQLSNNLFNAGNDDPNSIAHNQVVAGDRLYVSYYYDGLQVYDISEGDNPQRIGYYSTSTIAPRNNYEGAWGVYPFLPSGNILVSDMQEGLFVISPELTMVSTQDERYADVKVYPNPASTELYIQSEQGISDLQLMDLNGRTIDCSYEKGERSVQLPNNLMSGMYILKLQVNDQAISKRVMIVNE